MTINLSQIVSDVMLEKSCSIRPDKDTEESKTIKLRVKFDGVTLKDVFEKALSQTVISWQNTQGRKKFDLWNNNQVVEVSFKAPGAGTKTKEELIAETKAMFMKAGLPEEQALELATKAVENPEVV